MYKVCRMTSQGTSLLTKISLCRVYQIKVNCVIKEGKCLIWLVMHFYEKSGQNLTMNYNIYSTGNNNKWFVEWIKAVRLTSYWQSPHCLVMQI